MNFKSEYPDNSLKILHITRNLPPLIGGMERLNWHMSKELSNFSETLLIGPDTSELHIPENVKFSGVKSKPLWIFLALCLFQALKITRTWKPDYILAGSGLTAPVAYIVAKLVNAKCITYIHGLDITVDNFFYQILWLPFIRKMDFIIANSNPTKALAVHRKVLKDKITVIHPGVEKSTKIFTEEEKNIFLKKYNLLDKTILLSVGRLAERKGLLEFVRESLPTISKAQPNTILVVIGDSPKDSLHAKSQSKESILEEAKSHGLDNKIVFLGRLSNEDLLLAYSIATVHIFPVKHDPLDPEGFGMVAIEAAMQGLPTAAFATGGIIDAVSDRTSGRLSQPGNYDSLSSNVIELIRDRCQYTSSTKSFSLKFTWDKFGKNLYALLNKKPNFCRQEII